MNKNEAKQLCAKWVALNAERLEHDKQSRALKKEQEEIQKQLEAYVGKAELGIKTPKIDENIPGYCIEQKYGERDIPARVDRFITFKVFEK